jgi:peptide/nickel transport system permease protein
MATIPIGAERTIATPLVRRGVRILRQAPLVPLAILGVLIAVALLAPVLAPHGRLDPVKPTPDQCLAKYGTPDCPYIDNVPPFWSRGGRLDTPLGTDFLGRDVLSRIMYGARIALFVGFFASFIGCTLGAVLGVVSAFWGGTVDLLLERLMDILLAFPQLILALAIASILGPAVQNVVIAISIPVIPRVARVVRAAALSVKENVYVEAVQALGATRRRVIVQHIIPNVVAPYIIMLTATLGAAILAEAALSYLGLGAAEPTPSWGLMLSGSAPSYAEKAPWIALFPGIAISLGVFGFNLFGDSLRDALDPKLRKG